MINKLLRPRLGSCRHAPGLEHTTACLVQQQRLSKSHYEFRLSTAPVLFTNEVASARDDWSQAKRRDFKGRRLVDRSYLASRVVRAPCHCKTAKTSYIWILDRPPRAPQYCLGAFEIQKLFAGNYGWASWATTYRKTYLRSIYSTRSTIDGLSRIADLYAWQ